jgi:hypothetical protein
MPACRDAPGRGFLAASSARGIEVTSLPNSETLNGAREHEVATAPLRLSAAQVRDLTRRFRRHESSVDVLQAKWGKMVCRMPVPNDGTVVLKLWPRPTARDRMRRAWHAAPHVQEARLLTHLRGHGVSVPRLLGTSRLRLRGMPYRHAVVLEDLGNVDNAMEHVKRLLGEGRNEQAERFEDQIIALTDALLESGVADADHSMINIVAAPSGRPFRLDFEIARLVRWPCLFPGLCGAMIGRLVATYAFTVQPDVVRAERFATRLARHLAPTVRVLRLARIHVERLLQVQEHEVGIDTRLSLPW